MVDESSVEDFIKDGISICCICENLKGTYMEQYHEADNHCGIEGYHVSSDKKECDRFVEI